MKKTQNQELIQRGALSRMKLKKVQCKKEAKINCGKIHKLYWCIQLQIVWYS